MEASPDGSDYNPTPSLTVPAAPYMFLLSPMTGGTPGYGGDATPNYMNGTGGVTAGMSLNGYGVNPGYNSGVTGAIGNSASPGGNSFTVTPFTGGF